METEANRKEKWKALKELLSTITLRTYDIRPHVYTSGHIGLTGSPDCKQCWLPVGKLKVGIVFQPKEPVYTRAFRYSAEYDRIVPDQVIILTHDDIDVLKHISLAVIDLMK